MVKRKNFVLDTNILIHSDGQALNNFEENNIWIPSLVQEELDNLKERKEKADTAYSARQAIRTLKDFNKKGNLLTGVPTDGGGTLRLFVDENLDMSTLPNGWNPTKPDNIILMETLDIAKKHPRTILVTNDGNMQLKAASLGIESQEYLHDHVDLSKLYTGRTILHIDDDLFEKFIKNKELPVDENTFYEKEPLKSGEYIILKTWQDKSLLVQFDGEKIVNLSHQGDPMFDVVPKNAGQAFFKESLMKPCDEVPLVCGIGPAGTGKTMLAMAAGLQQTLEENKYERVLLCRANIMLGGKDEQIGFLPGTEDEKIAPLFRGAMDSISKLLAHDNQHELQGMVEELTDRGIIEMQSIGYLRGRTIDNSFIILDECQNCTPSEMLSIVTRIGQNSKIVCIGDPNQIDNSSLNKHNNGLVYTVSKMCDDPLCEVSSFSEEESQRSPLAKTAAKRMALAS